MKFILLFSIFVCNELVAQKTEDSLCNILGMDFLYDMYNYDGYNYEGENRRVWKDEHSTVSSSEVIRWHVMETKFSAKQCKSRYENLKEVYIQIKRYYEGSNFNYLNSTQIKILTLDFEQNVRDEICDDADRCPKFNIDENFNKIEYLSVHNYSLGLENLFQCKNLRYLNISQNNKIDFIPLNIGSISQLKYLLIDSNILKTPEIAVIQKMNPSLNIISVSGKEIEKIKKEWLLENRLRNYSNSLSAFCDNSGNRNTNLIKGRFIYKDSTGRILFKGYFDNKGRLDGKIELFDSCGSTIETRYYRKSKPVKTWKKYDNLGRLILRIKMKKIPQYTYYLYYLNLEITIVNFKIGGKVNTVSTIIKK